jgi:hypothetical protein
VEAEKALNNLTARIEQATKFEVRIPDQKQGVLWIRIRSYRHHFAGSGSDLFDPKKIFGR